MPTVSLTSNRDHPRSRGEHGSGSGCSWQGQGSSPLTRGALAGVILDWLPERIIPAHAGSTQPVATRTVSHKDHPRSRGEHSHP